MTPKYGVGCNPSLEFFCRALYIPRSNFKMRCKYYPSLFFVPSVGSTMSTLHCCASAISGAMPCIPKHKMYKSVSKLPFVYFALCTFGVRPHCIRLNRSVGSPSATLHCCALAISGAMPCIPKHKMCKSVSKLPFAYFALCTFGVRPLLHSA